MVTTRQQQFQRWIDLREATVDQRLTKSAQATRHKCFISFHQIDEDEVKKFIEDYDSVFIPRVLGASDDDDFIDSDDTNYVMDQIRDKYLRDSTVTIVLVGKCTWARKYVDWEVYSTLRNDKYNRRSGLLAITLPSAANYTNKQLPPRVADNVRRDDKKNDVGYARWMTYPTSVPSLRTWIDDAFKARKDQAQGGRAHLIANGRDRKKANSPC